MATLGERLKALRTERKLYQSDIAELLKVSKSTIGMYEQDRRDPDTQTLKILSQYFDCSIDYLLGKTDHRDSYPEAQDFIERYKQEMKKSGFDLSNLSEDEIIEDIIKTMKTIKELNK